MTLIVSVIVKDGIVLAGDSFTTLTTRAPHATPEPQPIKPYPHTQKIFPFYENFGVGTWGQPSINDKSVYFAMRELENKCKTDGIDLNTVDDVAETIRDEILPLEFDEDSFGYYVAGFTGQTARIVKVSSSEDGIERSSFEELGIYTAGDTGVVDSIVSSPSLYDDCPPFHLFSLYNAIDYALFLIRTTIEFQQFSPRVSMVGGAIDVAVVTHLDGFRWIQRQPISSVLQGFTGVP